MAFGRDIETSLKCLYASAGLVDFMASKLSLHCFHVPFFARNFHVPIRFGCTPKSSPLRLFVRLLHSFRRHFSRARRAPRSAYWLAGAISLCAARFHHGPCRLEGQQSSRARRRYSFLAALSPHRLDSRYRAH